MVPVSEAMEVGGQTGCSLPQVVKALGGPSLEPLWHALADSMQVCMYVGARGG